MWQRFTERARKVVFCAQEEAGRLGHHFVCSEHLLLGLVREDDSVAARVLGRMGVRRSEVRSAVENQADRGDGRLNQDMQLTPRGKRVIDRAYDEARQLNNNYIGTEHLLLGLVQEELESFGAPRHVWPPPPMKSAGGDGYQAPAGVLHELGVDLERTRQEVRTLQGLGPAESHSPPLRRGIGGFLASLLRGGKRASQDQGEM